MDPIDYQGLAHFCEHMVVTGGSEKYPDENGFKTFAKSKYGYFTASTGSDMTSYVFKVPSVCFEVGHEVIWFFGERRFSGSFRSILAVFCVTGVY